jgi:hypothetical protein
LRRIVEFIESIMDRRIGGAIAILAVRGSSVTVLQVKIADFGPPDVEGQPPIAADQPPP